MRILVIEDDVMVAKTLEILLSSENYAVDRSTDGETALQMVEAFEYDLILCDLFLPKLDGITLCQTLRNKGFQMPILVLTGQNETHQKAVALNIGADDYVVKPFDPEELIARIQALFRRGAAIAQPIISWGNLRLDPSVHCVTYGNQPLSLTPKEYAILELFLRNSQRILSPKLILEHAWTSVENPGEETVRVHIKELRRKLKEAGAPTNLIETVYRVGYRLKPMMVNAADEQSAQAEPALSPSVQTTHTIEPPLTLVHQVLFLTQNHKLQKKVEALLTPEAIAIIPLTDADGLWHVLETDLPSALLLDLDTTQNDLIDQCRAVRQRFSHEQLPILVVLKTADASLMAQVFAAGADEIINQSMIEIELVARLTHRLQY